jgi:hypothetical protein
MNSTLNFSTATADLLTQELDKIELSSLTVGDAVLMTFAVYDGSNTTERDSWTTTYYADETGKITISGLARMWNSYILSEYLRTAAPTPSTPLGGIVVHIGYTFGETTGSCQRRLWYCRRKAGATLSALTATIPNIATVKKTRVGAKEPAVVEVPSSVTVKVNSTYILSGTMATREDTIPAATSGTYRSTYDVSPAVVAALLPTGGVLKEYRVKSILSNTTKSTINYVMTADHPHGTQLCWLNNFGCWETLLMAGAEDMALERSAETALGGDDLTSYNVEALESKTVYTGYVNNTILNQVRDLADSPLVFVLDGSTWKKVVVDGVAQERRRPSNEAPTASVTYRHAESEY